MVPRGVTHISCHYKNTIEGTGENKTNEQTGQTICLGLTQEQKGSMQHYISDSIYGLTLAWITSENSTKQLECRHLLTRSSSLDPIFSATVSGVDRISPCPVPHLCPWFHANCLPAPLSNQISSSVPLPLPATPRFQVQKPFVWFRAKTDKGIVCLAGHLYSVAFLQSLPVLLVWFSYPSFVISVRISEENTDFYHSLVSLLHILACFLHWFCPFRYLFINYLLF